MDKFKESFSRVYVNAKDRWTGIAGRTRTIILAVSGVILVSAIIITVILNQPAQVELCTAATSSEAQQIVAALADAGIDARSTRNNVIFLNDSRNIRPAQVALSQQNLPSSGQNNNVWNNNIGMFTTEQQANEIKKHQLQEWIRDYLRYIDDVDDAWVILDIPNTRNYVLVDNRGESHASVSVSLRPGRTLTRQQVNGIHSFIRTSVPGLKPENITLLDGNGVELHAGEVIDAGAANAAEMQKLRKQNELRLIIADDKRAELNQFLAKFLGPDDYSFTVSVGVEFSENKKVEEVVYTPVVGDNGILRNITEEFDAGGLAEIGGIVGTTVNSDIAGPAVPGGPNYPTLVDIQEGSDFYVAWRNQRNYEINEKRTSYDDNGLRISNVTATLVINSDPVSNADAQVWRELVATAVDTTPDKVMFMTSNFPPKSTPGGMDGRTPGEAVRDILIWIIIILGVLLIALFILALLTSGRKKRQIRYRGAIPAMDGMGGYLRDDSFQPMPSEPEGFDLPSLLDENETKDVVLKREIKEFSKSNPEIIAQLIRTWFREDEP